uniref:Uncharacterized protein n=1 Tax=Setaria viridis TaxID=4556 RepID=A0A4U6U506_SETVI|nr:hypothetical protein SEVIR_6G094966v2 [Setaria viridis]
MTLMMVLMLILVMMNHLMNTKIGFKTKTQIVIYLMTTGKKQQKHTLNG